MRVEEALKNGNEINPMEATVRCKDGSSRYIEFHFSPLQNTNIVSFVDLTEHKEAETVLQESEERFRHVADTAPVMIWMAGADKLCTYFNSPWLQFTGRRFEEELGNGWTKGVNPDDLQSYWETYANAFERQERFQMEYRLRRYVGQYRWVLDRGTPRFSPDGKPFALLDSPLREIHDLTVGADGSVYALALSDSASASLSTEPTRGYTRAAKPADSKWCRTSWAIS